MIEQWYAGCLRAVAAVHKRGIVHGSLGSGSFMVNTLEEAHAASLVVKVDNLGFGQVFTGACGSDSALEKGKRADREALAVAFLELTFCARSPTRTSLRHAESLPVVCVDAWKYHSWRYTQRGLLACGLCIAQLSCLLLDEFS